jgi:uncharacterized protein (UPF0264 family)
MTKLLISVRSASEADVALRHGTDLIDVKEPLRGALGAADADTIQHIADRVCHRTPLSVALGELLDSVPISGAMFEALGSAQYAKFGLAGCRDVPSWIERLATAIGGLPPGVKPVAVAYADWNLAASPEPRHVLSAARKLGCAALLLDTHGKTAGSLIDLVGFQELSGLVRSAHEAGLACALAGGLRPRHLGAVARLGPDLVAMRGAVCRGGRVGTIVPRLVARVAAAVHAAEPIDSRA